MKKGKDFEINHSPFKTLKIRLSCDKIYLIIVPNFFYSRTTKTLMPTFNTCLTTFRYILPVNVQ